MIHVPTYIYSNSTRILTIIVTYVRNNKPITIIKISIRFKNFIDNNASLNHFDTRIFV